MKKIILLLIILAAFLTSCQKFEPVAETITDGNQIENPSTGNLITNMSDLVISNSFDWSMIKTLDVQITLPEEDKNRLLYIYSQDGKRLYFVGHPDDESNVLRTKVTVPTYENVVFLKYGIGENYPEIGTYLSGNTLNFDINSTYKSSPKCGNCGGGSTPDFDCLTMWAIDDNNPGNLYYITLNDNPVEVNIEGDVSGLQDSEDMESLAIDSNGDMYFINVKNGSKLYKIPFSEVDQNPSTDVTAQYIGNTGVPNTTSAKITNLTFIGDELYGVGVKSQIVYQINTSNGNATQVGSLGYSGTFKTSGLTEAKDGTIYLLFTKENLSELWKFNSFPNGGITKVMTIAGSKKVESLAAHPNGYLYAADDYKFFKLDPVNLTTEVMVEYSSDIEGIDFYWDEELDCVDNGGDCEDDGEYSSSTFGGFQFDFDGVTENIDGTSTWTYTVTGVGGSKDLSHWVLALCNEHNLAVGYPNNGEIVTDPTLQVYGIKWDEEINKNGGTATFSFTLDGQYDVEPVDVAFKAGQNKYYCTIYGPDCEPSDPDPEPELFGTIAFEDLWPGKGDYDINDLVIEYDFVVTKDNNEYVESIEVTFEVRAFGAGLHNGFGFTFPNVDPSDIISVTGYDIQNTSAYVLDANGTEAGQSKATFILYDDAYRLMQHPGSGIGVNTDPPAPYVTPAVLTMNIDFVDGQVTYSQLDIGNFNPFIVKDQNREIEVHLPNYPNTDLANESYFGTYDDDTNVPTKYYLTEDNLPWAILIPERFDYPVEKQIILGAYYKFAEWAQSDGALFPDWYKDLPGYRNESVIY